MDADRGPDVGLARGERHGRARARDIGADRDHASHAGDPRPDQDGVEIVRELRELQVRVGVEEVRGHITPRTPAAFLTAPGLTQRIAPQRPKPVATASMAVTLIFAPASFWRTSEQAPTRSSPSITNARFGPFTFNLFCLATARNASGSDGTKSSWAPRPLGKPE